MGQVRLGQVDLATGELLEGATLAVFYPRRKNGFATGWFAMAQNPLMELAKADLGDEARRVLFALLSKLDFENFISLNQAELGRELGIKPSNMSRAVARLVQENVLLAGPRLQLKGTYTLNPAYGWKGSARSHQDALKARMKARGMSVVAGGASEALDDRTGDLFEV
jgi:hypothetical protein